MDEGKSQDARDQYKNAEHSCVDLEKGLTGPGKSSSRSTTLVGYIGNAQ